MVDSTTNVYQSEILAETKSVFIKDKPSVQKEADTDTELYATIDVNAKVHSQGLPSPYVGFSFSCTIR